MGGFKLIGPNYIFRNLPVQIQCRCIGYVGPIDSMVEERLLNKKDKVLDESVLTDNLVEKMNNVHIGDERRYSITRRVYG